MSLKRKQTEHPEYDDQRKRSEKSVAEPEGEGPIMNLVDDCLYTVFEKLSADSLVAINQTCTRFRELVARPTLRLDPLKLMVIEGVSDNKLVKGPSGERYIDCFEKKIRNVTLSGNLARKDQLSKLHEIYKNDSERLSIKAVKFSKWNNLSDVHGSLLEGVLKNVETVTFFNTTVTGEFSCILKFLPNMKRLTLFGYFIDKCDEQNVWMDLKYANLKYFAWHARQDPSIQKLKSLVKSNQQIKLSLSLTRGFPKPNTLDQLIEMTLAVDELFYETSGSSEELDKLKIICDQGLCKRLHLKISRRSESVIAKLVLLEPYIEGMYFEKDPLDKNFINVINTFKHLKKLHISVTLVAQQLKPPNLEELFVENSLRQQNFNTYQKVLLTFCKQLPALKKIYLRNNSVRFDKIPFYEMNSERANLQGASHLKIYFKSGEPATTGRLNDIQRQYSNIEVVRVETETTDNPFVNEYLVSRKFLPNPQQRRVVIKEEEEEEEE